MIYGTFPASSSLILFTAFEHVVTPANKTEMKQRDWTVKDAASADTARLMGSLLCN
jgi:hypothetical protein